MTHTSSVRRWFLVCAIAVLAAGCGAQVSDKYVIAHKPATLSEIPGSQLKQVTLTEEAVSRVGIQTAAVSEASGSLAVPSGALWMDVGGVFWVYTNPERNAFVRYKVTVEDDDGHVALLSEGPPVGTIVVTVGVPELFGEEVGVGK